MQRLYGDFLTAWLEGEEYKAAQQFQRNGGSLCCDEFAALFSIGLLRDGIHRWASGHGKSRTEYEKLWDHGWGGVAMAPAHCDISIAWRYAERSMEKCYRVIILPGRKNLDKKPWLAKKVG